MKISKILFLFIFFANYSLAGVWSHMGINGIDGAYSSINASISVREEAVRAIWASQINPLLQSIRNNTTEKKCFWNKLAN